jgi:hypothetical protein
MVLVVLAVKNKTRKAEKTMGQISKATHAITRHVKNTMPELVATSKDILKEIQVLEVAVNEMERQLLTLPDGTEKNRYIDTLLATAYGAEILKDIRDNPDNQYTSVIPSSLAGN